MLGANVVINEGIFAAALTRLVKDVVRCHQRTAGRAGQQPLQRINTLILAPTVGAPLPASGAGAVGKFDRLPLANRLRQLPNLRGTIAS